MDPKITCRTFVMCDDGDGYWVDTIDYEGGLWLVTKWLSTQYPNMYRPARLIRMDTLAHSDHGDILKNELRALRLVDPVPKAVLDGLSASQGERHYAVVEAPDLVIRR